MNAKFGTNTPIMNNWLWVALGGGLGACARYGVALLIPTSKTDISFPWATLSINLLGCFLIGVLWHVIGKNQQLNAFWIIGFLGGFTTFSSFGLDGLRMINQGAFTSFAVYLLISNIVGLLFVFCGMKIAELSQVTVN